MKSRTYYRTCPYCGANLDPGEICDCDKEFKKENEEKSKSEVVKEIVREATNPKEKRDMQYGVPEQNKYPLYDKKHVESAIRLFGHVEPRFEKELALAIIAKMKKYNIPFDMVGEENRLYKYIKK